MSKRKPTYCVIHSSSRCYYLWLCGGATSRDAARCTPRSLTRTVQLRQQQRRSFEPPPSHRCTRSCAPTRPTPTRLPCLPQLQRLLEARREGQAGEMWRRSAKRGRRAGHTELTREIFKAEGKDDAWRNWRCAYACGYHLLIDVVGVADAMAHWHLCTPDRPSSPSCS